MATIDFANILLERNQQALSYPSLYCKADQPVVEDEAGDGTWWLWDKGEYDFSTYFNSLSVQKLLKYTSAKKFYLHLELKGAAAHVIQTKGGVFSAHPEPVEAVQADVDASDDWQSVDLELKIDDDAVIVGFILTTEGKVAIRNSHYTIEYTGKTRPVEFVLATTTFKKEAFIERNIGLIKKHIVNSKLAADTAEGGIANHFHMYVMDNGRTLDAEKLSTDRVIVRPNENVGGAGGFTRGMIEAMEQKPKATHILLMDDDVAVSPESIKRTYALLRILKTEYTDAMISGAMLNYEIGEDLWEDTGWMTPEGTFAPAKPGLRLTKYEDVVFNETFRLPDFVRNSGRRYAAWWYCCIPISVIEENGLPLPVFVRCDDAEYGVRCGKDFITMNGLGIWHMSFHVRYNAAVERYQTTRNTMIAQATTGFATDSNFMYELHNNVRLELKKFGYANAELCLDAFEDFLKGPRFIAQKGVAEKTFMAANKHKEKMLSFPEVQALADKLGLKGFDLSQIDRQLVDGDKPRSRWERLEDYLTDNGQYRFKTEGEGYAVIPVLGWTYPAGAIHDKKYLVVIDWYNKKGAIRVKDPERYAKIRKRYERDLKYYKKNIERLRAEYAAAREELTSVAFWKHYLDME